MTARCVWLRTSLGILCPPDLGVPGNRAWVVVSETVTMMVARLPGKSVAPPCLHNLAIPAPPPLRWVWAAGSEPLPTTGRCAHGWRCCFTHARRFHSEACA